MIRRLSLVACAVGLMAAAPAPDSPKSGDKLHGGGFPAWMQAAAGPAGDKAAAQAERAPESLEALFAGLPGGKWRVDPGASSPGSKDFALASAPDARLVKAANKGDTAKGLSAPYAVFPPQPDPFQPNSGAGLSVPNCPGDPRCPR